MVGESYIEVKWKRSTYSEINLTGESQSYCLHNHSTGNEKSCDGIYSNGLTLNDSNKESVEAGHFINY